VPAEPVLQLWAPITVRWEAGHARHIDFAIENPTTHSVALAAPDPANARVEVYGQESLGLCGVAPARRATPGPPIVLEPGDRIDVRVDLDRACAALPAGQYRYEVSYRAGDTAGAPARPDESGHPSEKARPDGHGHASEKAHPDGHGHASEKAFTGTLPVRYGQVVVTQPAEAVCDPPAPQAADRARHGRAAQPGHGRGRAEGPAGDPAPQETR
jgi:hypothetical protein